jgi:hypothetical protein
MNPETLYPELKEMKSSEIFIEWAYIVIGFKTIKIHIRRIINKKEKIIFVKALKQEYIPEYTEIFNYVNLVTI